MVDAQLGEDSRHLSHASPGFDTTRGMPTQKQQHTLQLYADLMEEVKHRNAGVRRRR